MTFWNRQNSSDKRLTADNKFIVRTKNNLGTSISATPKSDLKIDFEKIRTPDNTTNYIKSNSIKPNIIKHKLQETLATGTSYADKKPMLATVSFGLLEKNDRSLRVISRQPNRQVVLSRRRLWYLEKRLR